MTQHKWHKEIKAWADGADIQHRMGDNWIDCKTPQWGVQTEYRIKSQPKEPQYLYAYKNENGRLDISCIHQKMLILDLGWECIGKIKLESEDE